MSALIERIGAWLERHVDKLVYNLIFLFSGRDPED